MGNLYVVRCNFTDLPRRDQWNHWYSGEKQDWLLTRPGFLCGQRFEAEAVTDSILYLAIYMIESLAVFETEEYRSGWGFGEWAGYISDWSRSMFDGGAAEDFLTDTGALHVAFTSAERQSAGWAGDGWNTFPAAADGQPYTSMSLRLANDDKASPAAEVAGAGETGVFRPISPPRYAAVPESAS
jgi:hypothetical protein